MKQLNYVFCGCGKRTVSGMHCVKCLPKSIEINEHGTIYARGHGDYGYSVRGSNTITWVSSIDRAAYLLAMGVN